MSKKVRFLFIPLMALWGCMFYLSPNLHANNHLSHYALVPSASLSMEENLLHWRQAQKSGEATVLAAVSGNKNWLPPVAIALYTAVGANDIESVEEMIARGADVNSRMEDTLQTPLMAVESAEMASLLLKAGADARLVDSQGATALHYAVLKEKAVDIIPLLLSAGADVNAVDSAGGETAFQWAKQWFFGMDPDMGEKVLALLLQNGADINAKDKFGDTLLYAAVMNRKEQLVKFLLDKEADASLANGDGRTPLDAARDLKFPEIESLLGNGFKRQSR